MVVVDRLENSAQFIPVKSTYFAEEYARIYINEIVSLHCIPLSIIRDWGAQFTYQSSRSFKKLLGTQMKLSTTFHSQTVGQEEWAIQILEDMLTICVIDSKGSLDKYFPLVEFSFNNSYH